MGVATLFAFSNNDVEWDVSIKHEFDSVWGEFLKGGSVEEVRSGWQEGINDFLKNLNGTIQRSPLLVESELHVLPKWRKAHTSRVRNGLCFE